MIVSNSLKEVIKPLCYFTVMRVLELNFEETVGGLGNIK